ncbi:virion structural protein [Pseudomonas phage vB_PpuM-Lauda]
MLSFDVVHLRESQPVQVAEGIELTNEGCALVITTGADGELAVKPSTGVAGERFFGININQTQFPDFLPKLQGFEANRNSTTLVLDKAVADAGSLRLVATAANGTKTTLTAGDAATAGKFSLASDGKTVTLNAAQKDQAIQAGYRYTPTVVEAASLQGEQSAGRTAAAFLGITTAITKGELATSEFDTNVDWSPETVVTLGANGLFTSGGNGTVLQGVAVLKGPDEGYPFLKLVLL